MAPSIAEAAGRNARALRLGAGVKLDDFALAAKSYGLPWTSGRVGDFESGRASPSLPTLYAVAAALGQVIGRPVSLVELFAGEGSVQINEKLSVKLSVLRDALSGDRVTTKPGTINVTATAEFVLTPGWAGITPSLHLRVLNGFRESDSTNVQEHRR